MTTIGSVGVRFLNLTTQNTSALINVQTFNASGTWTKPTGYTANSRVLIQAWGAGGSGGRNGTTIAYAGGGGGGGYNESWLLLSQLGATETVTVGAGGAARTTNIDGATGGTTSVGSLINAFGGAGGQSAVSAVGGGGGGQLSAGGSGQIYLPGLPYILYDVAVSTTLDLGTKSTSYLVSAVIAARHGEGGRNRGGGAGGDPITINGPIMGYVHGGGGGGTGGNAGANTVYGGGGGGGIASGAAGGASSFGGVGGAAGATATGGAGTQPGGGGGGATVTSGAGGAGRVSITVFPNSN